MAPRDRLLIKRLFARLEKSKPHHFPAPGKGVEAPNEQGVYLIYSPKPKNEVVHVGRTYRGTKGLRQRLNNHLHSQSSFVQIHLKGHGARLRKGYSFRYLPVESSRHRALLEAYATGMLCPEHIGLSEKK